MANAVKWQTGNTRKLVENGALNAGESITVQLDNVTNKDRYADIQLTVGFDVAPAIGGVFTLWANPRVLGSATDDTLGTPIGAFPINNATGTQTSITVKGVMLSPAMIDFTLRNDTNQNAVIGSVQLSALTYNEEIQ